MALRSILSGIFLNNQSALTLSSYLCQRPSSLLAGDRTKYGIQVAGLVWSTFLLYQVSMENGNSHLPDIRNKQLMVREESIPPISAVHKTHVYTASTETNLHSEHLPPWLLLCNPKMANTVCCRHERAAELEFLCHLLDICGNY